MVSLGFLAIFSLTLRHIFYYLYHFRLNLGMIFPMGEGETHMNFTRVIVVPLREVGVEVFEHWYDKDR